LLDLLIYLPPFSRHEKDTRHLVDTQKQGVKEQQVSPAFLLHLLGESSSSQIGPKSQRSFLISPSLPLAFWPLAQPFGDADLAARLEQIWAVGKSANFHRKSANFHQNQASLVSLWPKWAPDSLRLAKSVQNQSESSPKGAQKAEKQSL